MSDREHFFERGEVLNVVLPIENSSSDDINKLRATLTNNSITRVIILARNCDDTYYAVSCHDTAMNGDIKVSIGNQRAYARVLPLLIIEGIALRRFPNSVLADTRKTLLKIEYQQQIYGARKGSSKSDGKIKQLEGFDHSMLLQNIPKSSATVVCPRCQKRIPTANRDVFIDGLGFQVLRVGLCDRCCAYYSHDNRLLTGKGVLNGKNVAWSNLRYRKKDGQLVLQHTLPPVNKQMQLYASQQPTQANITSTSQDSFRKYAPLLCQLPVVLSRKMNCPICRKASSDTARIRYYQYSETGDSEVRYGCSRICTNCDIVFLDQGQVDEIKQRAAQKQVFFVNIDVVTSKDVFLDMITRKPDRAPSKPLHFDLPFDFNDAETPNISFEADSVFVYARKCECQQCQKHYGFDTVRNRTAVINTMYGETVNINVLYCCGCGTYFMSIVSFREYKKRYGGLLLEYCYTGELAKKHRSDFNLAADSILSRCDYTADGSISKEHRQAILAFVLDSGKATKSRVIMLLQSFLELGERRKNCPDACARWREDIFFVNQYQIDLQKKVYGLTFQQGK